MNEGDKEMKQAVRVALDIIMDAVIETIGIDGHMWSDRPCQTCKAVSGLIGKPYGCYWYQEQKEIRRTQMKGVKHESG